MWMRKQFPELQFERYCDDGVVHCVSEKQAQSVRGAISERLAQCGLELHPDKTRIVYCKDGFRRATYANERFEFLGHTFRPRRAKDKAGKCFVSFLPAVSNDAMKKMGHELRSWRLNRRSDKALGDLARMFNVIVQGWSNYYGHFYRSALYPLLRRINDYLVRWAKRKYKRLQTIIVGRGSGWCALQGANRRCSSTGDLARGQVAGQWERCERRRSRTVLREPRGATPLRHSPMHF
jgi:hypothetical protein